MEVKEDARNNPSQFIITILEYAFKLKVKAFKLLAKLTGYTL